MKNLLCIYVYMVCSHVLEHVCVFLFRGGMCMQVEAQADKCLPDGSFSPIY